MLGICSWWYVVSECHSIDTRKLDSLDFSIKLDVERFSKVQLWMERMTKLIAWNIILEVIESPPIQNKSVVMEIEKFLQCEYLLIFPVMQDN